MRSMSFGATGGLQSVAASYSYMQVSEIKTYFDNAFLVRKVAGRQRLCYTPPKSRRMQYVCAMSSFWPVCKH